MEENLEEKETKVRINAREELDNIICKTVCEFENTMDNFEIDKVKAIIAKDEQKTVNLLFYDNDFFAINRINYRNGYEYNKKKDYETISENMNYRIKKIPNVAKARRILNIDDIEARIYDVSEYIVLLSKEDIKLLRVNGQDQIHELVQAEYKVNKEQINQEIEAYNESIIEENSIKNKIKKFAQSAKSLALLIRNKLLKTNEVKMLSDGKHSIFDKED